MAARSQLEELLSGKGWGETLRRKPAAAPVGWANLLQHGVPPGSITELVTSEVVGYIGEEVEAGLRKPPSERPTESASGQAPWRKTICEIPAGSPVPPDWIGQRVANRPEPGYEEAAANGSAGGVAPAWPTRQRPRVLPGHMGLTSLALRLAAHAQAAETSRPVAWVDPSDRFDPRSAAARGVMLPQLLWVKPGRREGAQSSGPRRAIPEDPALAVERSFAVTQLLVHAGAFGLVVLDVRDLSPPLLRRVPRATWFRLQRGLERVKTTALLVLSPKKQSR
ncbi:MAG: hypothetical protein ACYC6M_00560 [Terriglobales bacterium]